MYKPLTRRHCDTTKKRCQQCVTQHTSAQWHCTSLYTCMLGSERWCKCTESSFSECSVLFCSDGPRSTLAQSKQARWEVGAALCPHRCAASAPSHHAVVFCLAAMRIVSSGVCTASATRLGCLWLVLNVVVFQSRSNRIGDCTMSLVCVCARGGVGWGGKQTRSPSYHS